MQRLMQCPAIFPYVEEVFIKYHDDLANYASEQIRGLKYGLLLERPG